MSEPRARSSVSSDIIDRDRERAPSAPGARPGLRHGARALLLALLAAGPALLCALLLLWRGALAPGDAAALSPKLRVTASALVLACFAFALLALREEIARPLRTLANLLGGLRRGDYSLRARGARVDDDLGLALHELNELASILREQRLGALEATALLREVMAEINVAVFTFDQRGQLQLVNQAGARLLARPAERLLGLPAAELGLLPCLECPPVHVIVARFPGALEHGAAPGERRWAVRRSDFRQGGRPHQLLVLSDLSRALREEERLAHRRLIRVLSHEINNSLTPIHSIARSLGRQAEREPRAPDWDEDVREGLDVIARRADGLRRFMGEYARLARLPPPRPRPFEVAPWVRRLAGLETRAPIELRGPEELTITADPDQLEQALLNLLRNAADASVSPERPSPNEPPQAITLAWRRDGDELEFSIRDRGPGLARTANLFVPFFTTKPGGSGIGLVLARQIAEGHGGELTLRNHDDGPGCVARLRLPVTAQTPA